MTVLPDLEMTVDAALLQLEDGQQTVLRTAGEAARLRTLLGRAETRLHEMARDRETRRDHEAAVAMNTSNLPAHLAYGFTIAAPAPRVSAVVVISACGCSKSEQCPTCDPYNRLRGGTPA